MRKLIVSAVVAAALAPVAALATPTPAQAASKDCSALRAKIGLRATVRLPDGSERVFDLEPTGVGVGRVRGRDREADVERTLPVASITALEPLDA